MSEIVKGCQMPAHAAMHWPGGTGSEGRRRTSPEGRNRGAQAGYFSVPGSYGDLNDHGGVSVWNNVEVVTLKPIAMVSRG